MTTIQRWRKRNHFMQVEAAAVLGLSQNPIYPFSRKADDA